MSTTSTSVTDPKSSGCVCLSPRRTASRDPTGTRTAVTHDTPDPVVGLERLGDQGDHTGHKSTPTGSPKTTPLLWVPAGVSDSNDHIRPTVNAPGDREFVGWDGEGRGRFPGVGVRRGGETHDPWMPHVGTLPPPDRKGSPRTLPL